MFVAKAGAAGVGVPSRTELLALRSGSRLETYATTITPHVSAVGMSTVCVKRPSHTVDTASQSSLVLNGVYLTP